MTRRLPQFCGNVPLVVQDHPDILRETLECPKGNPPVKREVLLFSPTGFVCILAAGEECNGSILLLAVGQTEFPGNPLAVFTLRGDEHHESATHSNPSTKLLGRFPVGNRRQGRIKFVNVDCATVLFQELDDTGEEGLIL